MDKKRYFKLTSDLDFSSEKGVSMIALDPFASIDGNQHTIRNLTLEHGHGAKDAGIYGQLTKDLNGNRDEIKNLNFENIKIMGDGLDDGGGIIAGANWGGIISNVHVTGSVIIESQDPNDTSFSVGGLVGQNSSIIENSSFNGVVRGMNNVGGIAGKNDGTIRNSTASGSVKGLRGVGGLVGLQLQQGVSERNSATIEVKGLSSFGDIIGIRCTKNSYLDCPVETLE